MPRVEPAIVYVSTANPRTRMGGWPESRMHRARRVDGGFRTDCGKTMRSCDVWYDDPHSPKICERCFPHR